MKKKKIKRETKSVKTKTIQNNVKTKFTSHHGNEVPVGQKLAQCQDSGVLKFVQLLRVVVGQAEHFTLFLTDLQQRLGLLPRLQLCV